MENKQKNINISDSFKIKDEPSNIENNNISPIVGVITIYDENGNIVTQKHNMVVKSGRKLMKKLFQLYFSKNSDSSNSHSGTLSMSLSYASTYVQTQFDMTYDSIFGNLTDEDKLTIWTTELTQQVLTNNNELSFVFNADIASTSTFHKFNQICLIYTENNDASTSILFSRVALDPIFLGSDGKYKIAYTLYF